MSMQIEDLQTGDGAEAKVGNTVAVHYTGWLTDGTKPRKPSSIASASKRLIGWWMWPMKGCGKP